METKKLRTNMTMSDFEKGLVLAGILTPITKRELDELDAIKEFESKQQKDNPKFKASQTPKKKNDYFKRIVLAAEIVNSLHDEPTFGRVKFQKLVYLCEQAVSMYKPGRYQKQTAGPFDRKFMHSVIPKFRSLNWFEVVEENRGVFKRSKYKPLEKCEDYKKYYKNYFKDTGSLIQNIISLFRKRDTEFTEISATLFFCYQEIQDENCTFSEDELVKRFYSFSDRKAIFDKQRILENWQWMKTNKLINL